MSENSLDFSGNLDVEEGAVIQSVQASVFDFMSNSVISDIINDSGANSAANSKLSKETSPKATNYVKKNIEVMKKKKNEVNINDINISELCLEEEEKKTPINVDERFYKYKEKVNEKLKVLGQELKEKEMVNCTFKPEVKSQGEKRSATQFISQMQNYEKLKKGKIEALRAQQNEIIEEIESHHPAINQRSKEILAKKKDAAEPIYEKLYKDSKKPKDKTPPKQSVTKLPSKRNEPIDKILYEDALRRASKKTETITQVKEVQVNSKSQQVITQKFSKEFNEIIESLCEKAEELEIEQVLAVLAHLRFIKNSEENPRNVEEKTLTARFIKMIEAEGKVKTEALFKMCLSVMNIYESAVQNENSEKPTAKDEALGIKKEDALKIHKAFILFYENRKSSSVASKKIEPQDYSFKPVLNPESSSLAKKVQQRAGSLCSQKREDFLQREKKKTQEKIDLIKKAKEEEEVKDCTFKPSIIKKSYSRGEISQEKRATALYENYKEIQEKKDQKMKELIQNEKEKDLAECTFAPRLEKIKVKEDKEILQSRSVQQQLYRLQKAREEQERKRSILEGPSKKPNVETPQKKPPKVPLSQRQKSPPKILEKNLTSGISLDNFQKMYENPPERPPEKNEEIDEELQLNVKMPDGSQKTLIIPPGADIDLKLSMFILENNLSSDLAEKLRKSLKNIY